MNLRVIDTHTHYTHPCFDNERNELLTQLHFEGVIRIVESAISFSSNPKVVELCEEHDFVYGSLGVHPKHVGELNEGKFQEIEKMLGKTRKILAIGETGLDYSKCVGEETKEIQKRWFRKFVELSLHQVLPLVIHCRDAYHDLIKILSEYYFPWKPGVVHCFSGSVEEGKKLVDIGFYLGIGGKIVREEDLRSVIKEIPLEAIVLETDAPYLSPIPREKVNTSKNLGRIIEELAKLKGITKGEVMWTTLENTYNLYPKLRHRI